jgi:hypothetical protein
MSKGKKKNVWALYVGKVCPFYQGQCQVQKCVFWDDKEGCLYLKFIKSRIEYFEEKKEEKEKKLEEASIMESLREALKGASKELEKER